MSEDMNLLCASIFSKLESYGFTPKEFLCSKDISVSGDKFSEIKLFCSAIGILENVSALKESLSPEESCINLDFDFEVQPGDPCSDLQVIIPSTGEQKTLLFSETDPKLYLIHFWDYYMIYEYEHLIHNDALLSKNPSWHDNVEFICISMDSEAEVVNRAVQENNWTRLSIYWAGPETHGEDAPVKLKLSGVPKYVLVRHGKVIWSGHPDDRRLEDDINGLIENREVFAQPTSESGSYSSLSEEEHHAMLKNMFQNFFMANTQILSPPEVLSTYTTSITRDNISKKHGLCIYGSVFHRDKEIVESFVKNMRGVCTQLINQIKYIDMLCIERGESCSVCSREFQGNDTQYLCIYAKTQYSCGEPREDIVKCEHRHYHCEDCHNSTSRVHEHPVYKIHAQAGGLDSLRDKRGKVSNEAMCENSGSANGECEDVATRDAMYMCAHCKKFTLCRYCERRFQLGTSEELNRRAREKNHMREHVMIYMPFLDLQSGMEGDLS